MTENREPSRKELKRRMETAESALKAFRAAIYGMGDDVFSADFKNRAEKTNQEAAYLTDWTEEQRIRWIMETRLSLIERAENNSVDEFLTRALDEIGTLVDSPIGFYHFLETDQNTLSLRRYSTRTLQAFCRAEGKLTHFDIDRAGVWADCARQKRPLIYNDFASLSNRNEMPQSHAEIIRFLAAPVIRSEKVVAVVGFGNKHCPYTRMDLATVSYLADVTWQIVKYKLAENALRESEERLALAMQGADLCIWDWNVQTGELMLNEKWTELLGYEPNEIVPNVRIWENLVHPDDKAAVMEKLNAHLEGKTPSYENEYRVRAKNGNWVWILDRGKVIERDANGIPVRAAGSHLDITEQKKSEEKLRQSEEKFSRAFHTSPYAITITRLEDGKIIEVNDAFVAITGFTREEALGRSTAALNLWIDPANRTSVVSDLLEGKKVADREYRFRRKSGEIVIGLFSAQVIRLENESCILSSTNDITEYKRSQEERARLEKQFHHVQKLESIGRLAGGVAHDLNNLLSPIMGYGEILLYETGEDCRRKEHLKQILKAAGRARDLVRQLLAFSRRQTLEFRAIDLNDLVKNFEKLLRRTIREDIAINILASESLPPVKGDVGQLEQVLLNLAVNAQDAMPDGGALTIETALVEPDQSRKVEQECSTCGKQVALIISDTGCGIDAEIRENIFEPFFTTKEKYKGTGLGLATVYGIVKQHGGNIFALSEPGMGATFKIYLPALEKSPEVGEHSSESQSDLRGIETILLVEDNTQVRKLAIFILERNGYTVLEAQSGEGALSILDGHKGPLHLLLTDVIMPEMDGRRLYGKVSSVHPNVRVLFMSGYTDSVIARHGVMDSGVHFIQKPFSIEALAAKVREVLDQ